MVVVLVVVVVTKSTCESSGQKLPRKRMWTGPTSIPSSGVDIVVVSAHTTIRTKVRYDARPFYVRRFTILYLPSVGLVWDPGNVGMREEARQPRLY